MPVMLIPASLLAAVPAALQVAWVTDGVPAAGTGVTVTVLVAEPVQVPALQVAV